MKIKEIFKHIESANELKKALKTRLATIELSINDNDYEQVKSLFELVGKVNNYLRLDSVDEYVDLYNVISSIEFTKMYNTLSAEFYMFRKVKLDLFIDFSD